jgi:hypothetical protein
MKERRFSSGVGAFAAELCHAGVLLLLMIMWLSALERSV